MATAHVTTTQPEVHNLGRKALPDNVHTPMDLLSLALAHDAGIDVIERLAALQEKVLMRDAKTDFNNALSRIQAAVARIAPDLLNPQTSSKYASYAAIDRIVRPLYTAEGMSLSFSHGDSPKPDHIRVICVAGLGAYTRTYQIDMPTDGKGIKGNDAMTKTHATAAADSYAKRYLVKDVFNLAIGEDDTDGNPPASGKNRIASERVREFCQKILKAETLEAMKQVYFAAYREAHEFGDAAAEDAYVRAKDERRKGFPNGNL
jgi:ERF superfamily